MTGLRPAFPTKVDLPTAQRPFSLVWRSSDSTFDDLPKSYHVLDSSFNPPTLAHASLCEASYGSTTISKHLLLLLSTKNVDKIADERPSAYEKLQMIHAFGMSLLSNDSENLEITIGCLSEPTFAGKADVLLDVLPKGSHLAFILGWE